MEKALSKTDPGMIEPLTRRELEILTLLDANRSNQEIAQNLAVALTTVKWHAQQIYRKLGVENRRQAVAKAKEIGLLFGRLASSTSIAIRHPGNLPVQLTRFIGREHDISEVKKGLSIIDWSPSQVLEDAVKLVLLYGLPVIYYWLMNMGYGWLNLLP